MCFFWFNIILPGWLTKKHEYQNTNKTGNIVNIPLDIARNVCIKWVNETSVIPEITGTTYYVWNWEIVPKTKYGIAHNVEKKGNN